MFQTLVIAADLLRPPLIQCLQALLQLRPVRLRLLQLAVHLVLLQCSTPLQAGALSLQPFAGLQG